MNVMTSTAPPARPAARFSGLDGLRAVAVALVVVYHLFPPTLLPGGFIGVDVFFVLSGFLITTLLLREHAATGRVALGRFWQRRARRLLPALALVVATCSTLALLVGGDVLVGLGTQVLGAATFSYNWMSVATGGGYFSQATPELLRNVWSLAVEEQFYLLWPLLFLLFLLIRRAWARVVATGALAAASAAWMAVVVGGGSGDPTRAYFGTDTHAFGLLLGVALAFLLAPLLSSTDGGPRWAQTSVARAATGVAGILSVAGIVVVAMLPATDSALTFPGALLAASALSGIAIVAGVWPGSWFGPALDVQPLRWIGDRSYGIYLWHWPLLVLAMAAIGGMSTADVPVGIGVAVLAVTAAAAAASYRFVEMPIRRRGLRASVRARGAVAALSAVVMLVGTGAAIAAAPDETSGEAAVQAGRDALDEAARQATPAPTPADGAHVPGDQVSAVGDSVMLASAPALLERLPGIEVDAEVSRSVWAGPRILDALDDAGRLRPYVVVALGTNGPVSADVLDAIADAVGPQRELILVNAYAPRDWIPGVNADLQTFADRRPNVSVADWAGAIAPHPDLLAGDQIHPGDAGGQIFAETVANAVDAAERARVERTRNFLGGLEDNLGIDLDPARKP
jgi:peptidoglycan/LPS O-acetylase OafA/YrhL